MAPSFGRNPLVKLATTRAPGATVSAGKVRVVVRALDVRVICQPSRLTERSPMFTISTHSGSAPAAISLNWIAPKAGAGVGVAVSVAVIVAVGVALAVTVAVAVRLAVGVALTVAVAVRLAVGVALTVAVAVRLTVGVALAVAVALAVGVAGVPAVAVLLAVGVADSLVGDMAAYVGLAGCAVGVGAFGPPRVGLTHVQTGLPSKMRARARSLCELV